MSRFEPDLLVLQYIFQLDKTLAVISARILGPLNEEDRNRINHAPCSRKHH